MSQAIKTVKVRITDAEKKLEELRTEGEQKMIACHLFRRIEVGRGYQIRAEFNMTYRQFCSEWGGSDLLGETVG